MRRCAERWDQQAAATLDRRIDVPEIWHVADRNAVHLQHGILVFDLLVLEILHRRKCADLPERRLGRVLGAEIAGGVHHARHLVDLPLGAPRAVGGQPAILRENGPHVAHHTVLHVLRELGIVGEQHLAVRFEQRNVPLGRGNAGIAVERDAVGPQHVLVLPGLDMTLGDHQRVLAVILHGIGGEGDRRIAVALRLRRGIDERAQLRPRGVRQRRRQEHGQRQHTQEQAQGGA